MTDSLPPHDGTVAPAVRTAIEARLAQIEAAEGVTIFYACESGSRAWGFPSADSDYDVRFLYLHPRDWYLSINLERKRDVIERPIDGDLDLSGWDLRKALGLMRKSNPPLLEWLRSPIVYRASHGLAAALRDRVPHCYSPRASAYHYLHMARGNYESYLQEERVQPKRYFYVLRPLMAVEWIQQDRGPVPMAFEALVEAVVDNAALRQAIDALLARKRAGEELDEGPRLPAIHAFIERELERWDGHRFTQPAPKPPVEPLNALFRDALRRVE